MERVQPPCSRIVGVRDKIRIVIFVNYARIQNCGTALPIRDSIYSISSNYRKILFTIPLNSLVNLIRIFKLLDSLLNRRFDINMYLFKYRTLNLKRRKLIIFRKKVISSAPFSILRCKVILEHDDQDASLKYVARNFTRYFAGKFQVSEQHLPFAIISRAINRIPVHNRCGSNLAWRERVDRVT